MRKHFKLALAGLVVMSMIFTPVIALSPQDSLKNPIGGDIEVVILDETIPSEKADFIKAKLSGTAYSNENVISPMSIFCLFGHSTSKATAIKTTHSYYSSSPRCKVETYNIEFCDRSSCGYYCETLFDTRRTSCH